MAEPEPEPGSIAEDVPPAIKVVAFCGSIRGPSCNRGILRYAASCATTVAPRLDVTMLDVSTWPLYNNDDEKAKNIPAEVLAGVELVRSCDAVLIASPEYNFAPAPATTNAVAWLSRSALIEGMESSALKEKHLGLLSAGGGSGGLRAQTAIRISFPIFLRMATMVEPVCAISLRADPKPFDMATGDLVGEDAQKEVEAFMAAFQTWCVSGAAAAVAAAEEAGLLSGGIRNLTAYPPALPAAEPEAEPAAEPEAEPAAEPEAEPEAEPAAEPAAAK
jgi:chromate reductase